MSVRESRQRVETPIFILVDSICPVLDLVEFEMIKEEMVCDFLSLREGLWILREQNFTQEHVNSIVNSSSNWVSLSSEIPIA